MIDQEFDFPMKEIASTVKYKYQCGENQIHPALVGVSNNLILFPWNSSAGRLYMAGNMIPKSVPTKGAGERMMVTGAEFQYAKTARRIEAPAHMLVEELFYVGSLVDGKLTDDWTSIFILFKNDETNNYDLLELPMYNTQNTYVGFEYVYDKEVMSRLRKGATFSKGTVFARSPRISKNGEWCFTMPTLVAAYSDYRTEEDGIIITRSFAERSRCMFKLERNYSYNEDEYIPLLLYGTEENPSPFPQNGEAIRPDGIVMGFRRRIKENALVSLTKKALREPDTLYDELFYVPQGSEVMAVSVTSERPKKRSNNRNTTYIEQRHNKILDRYEKKQNEMNNEIIRWYETKRAASRDDKLSISFTLDTFIRNAYGNYTVSNIGKPNTLTRANKTDKLKDWNIHIELRQSMSGRIKWKYAGLNGDKGVNVYIIEDHEAPCYPDGTRAEFISNNMPAFRRQIFSLLMELSINFINMNVQREVSFLRKQGDYTGAIAKVMEFLETAFPEFAEIVAREISSQDDQIEYIDHIAKDKIAVHVISNTKLFGVNIINALRKVYGDRYKPQKATFVNSLGELDTTVNPILISYQDIMLLDKFGTDMSAQGMPKSNLFGMAAKMSDSSKYSNPMNDKNNKNTGETENRLEQSQAGPQEVAKQMSLAYSPENRIMATKRKIRADDPFDINQVIKPEEYINNRALAMSVSMLADSGHRLRRERPSDRTDRILDRAMQLTESDKNLLDLLNTPEESGEQVNA